MRRALIFSQNQKIQMPHLAVKLTLVLLYFLGLAACSQSRYLVGSPNLYLEQGVYPDTQLVENLQSPLAELLFVTDRLPNSKSEDVLSFGHSRSSSLALGSLSVQLGKNLSWSELRNVRNIEAGNERILLNVSNIQELVRFPKTPLPFNVIGGRAVPKPASAEALKNAERKAREVIRSRLQANSSEDVFIFVHGVHNEFDDASMTLAELWHYTGRTTVPILYSWPAGNSGLTWYFKDRESGEFSVFHLKMFLRFLSKMPEVKNIHILAHSRGNYVVTTAVRELMIETWAKGQNPRKQLKIANLIMAAPDLDFGVVQQRLISEAFGLAVGQITVYMNPGDSALGISQSLMAGIRFGRIQAEDISEVDKAIFAAVKNVHFIDVEGEGGVFGHTYFTRNPAVLSDIGLIINQRARPGTTERPLINVDGNFWHLPNNYP